MKLGIIGHNGIVGRVLKERIKKKYNNVGFDTIYLNLNINNLKKFFYSEKKYKLLSCKILIICKDSFFSKLFYKKIKKFKWKGYLVDASSEFRMKKNSLIVLDPINKKQIINSLLDGKRIFCGCNCTVSLTLLSLLKLIKKNLIKEIFSNSYQAISGAGYLETYNLFKNNLFFLRNYFKKNFFKKFNDNILNYFKKYKLSFSILPWIGNDVGKKNSEEEIKGYKETNKILKNSHLKNIKVFSTCVRVNVFRSHSISLILKLKKDFKVSKFKNYFNKNKYVKLIKNNKRSTEKFLNPIKVSNKTKISVGRIKKIKKKTFSLFIVGDQLIWGAAEPLIRTAIIIKKFINNEY